MRHTLVLSALLGTGLMKQAFAEQIQPAEMIAQLNLSPSVGIGAEVLAQLEAALAEAKAGALVPYGMETLAHNLVRAAIDACLTEEELLNKIQELNESEEVDGFIVQLPLPKHINTQKVLEAVDPKKDVDGFHPINIGRMAKGLPAYISATPQGVLDLLERYNIETAGKHCVVVGRSQIVGLPMTILMQRNTKIGNCTVTITHSRTKNLAEVCASADILIAAIGQPGFVTAEMVKEGAVVIDVGTTRVEDASRARGWRLNGDVDFENVAPKCSFITPVPGGVGPMTIASLMINTLKAMELKGK